MKKLMTLTMVFCIATTIAQTNKNDRAASGISESMIKAANSNQNFGAGTVFFNPEKKAEGSVHLYENWNNFGIIHAADGQKFSLKNINFNIETNTFQSKIGQDSLFTFNFNNIKRVEINGRSFKSYFYNGESRVFQVIHKEGEVELLKGYKVQLIKGSANPMLNRSTDKYVQKEYFFINENDIIKPFKLKKKNVQELVNGDKALAERIMNKAKDN